MDEIRREFYIAEEEMKNYNFEIAAEYYQSVIDKINTILSSGNKNNIRLSKLKEFLANSLKGNAICIIETDASYDDAIDYVKEAIKILPGDMSARKLLENIENEKFKSFRK